MIKVSVIVPVYGVEDSLRAAVDGVLQQSLKELELLLIDDGSPDNCPALIDQYAQQDRRVVAIHKLNGGYGQSCNLGLARARGEYVAILEPDDHVDPQMYQALYAIAKRFDSDVVKSSYYEHFASKRHDQVRKVRWDDAAIPQQRSFTLAECSLFLQYHPSIWSCLYKREFLRQQSIRFIEAAGAGWSDNPFQVQTLCLARRINYTPVAYYHYQRPDSLAAEVEKVKDYRIPFQRSEEIHAWLQQQWASGALAPDREVLYHLYRRELSYIELLLMKRGLIYNSEFRLAIKRMIERMDEGIIYAYGKQGHDHGFIRHFKTIKRNPIQRYYQLRFKMITRGLLAWLSCTK